MSRLVVRTTSQIILPKTGLRKFSVSPSRWICDLDFPPLRVILKGLIRDLIGPVRPQPPFLRYFGMFANSLVPIPETLPVACPAGKRAYRKTKHALPE
jgi:hypothetical protein